MSDEASGKPINQAEKRRDFFITTSLQTANTLRKLLSIDEINYQKVVAYSHEDGRAYFIYGCLDEVIKAATACLRYAEFLSEPIGNESKDDGEDGKHISRAVLEAVFDEQQMWARKLNEILVDLILFKKSNDQRYYRLYLVYRYFEKYIGFQGDLEEFFNCRSGNADISVKHAASLIRKLEAELGLSRIWFLRSNKLVGGPKPGSIFTSFRSKLKSALEIATADERITLGVSYDRGYSRASKSIHSNVGDPLPELTEKTIDAQIGRIGLLSAHIVITAYVLLEIEPTGLAAQLKSTLNGTDAGIALHSELCKEFNLGDIVLAYGSYISVVVEVAKSRYGYTACKVRYLTPAPLEETPEDWFSSPYVRVVASKSTVLPLVREQLKKCGAKDAAESLTDEKFIDVVSGAIRDMDKAGHLKLFFKLQ